MPRIQIRRDIHARKPVVVPINHTWAMDLSFHTDAHKHTHSFVGLIDHGSRVALYLQTLINRSSWTMLGHLCLAIGQYGKPRTDNERIFNSFVFKTFLKLVGIHKQTINTHSPWQNGRIERLFGTLKPLLRQLVINNKTALQNTLKEFKCFYNHARGHSNLNGLTPAQVWQQQARPHERKSRKTRRNRKSQPPQLVQTLDGLLTGVYQPPDG